MKVCRLCLATGVKFTILGDPRLKDFIESILKSKGYPKDLHEKNYVCIECKAFSVKTFNFIQRVLRAQKALYMMNPVTAESLKSLNRHNLNLLPTLSYHKVEIDSVIEEKSKLEITCFAQSSVNDILVPLQTENIPYTYSDGNEYDAEDIVKKEVIEEYADPITTATTTCVTVVGSSLDGVKTDNCYPKSEIELDHLNNSNKTKTCKPKRKRLKGTIINTDNIVTGARKKKAKFVISNPESDDDNVIEKKTKKKKKDEDDDYKPHKSSDESESSLEPHTYDDDGKRIRRPKDNRVYPMQCDHCDYEIEQKSVHYKHYLYCHPNVEYPYLRKKTFICQFCGVTKANACLLRDHELIHGNEKNFKCTLCPEMFHNRVRLKRHKDYYHRELLICDYCKKTFRMKCDLRLHIRTHTGEKPFKCHICGVAFAHRGNVGIHIRHVHQKEKNKNTKRQKKRGKHKDDTDESDVDSDTCLSSIKKCRKGKSKDVNVSKNPTKSQRRGKNKLTEETHEETSLQMRGNNVSEET